MKYELQDTSELNKDNKKGCKYQYVHLPKVSLKFLKSVQIM